MNITKSQYIADVTGSEKNVSIKATIDGAEVYVSLDPDNRHYAEIVRQVEAGELTIADAD